MFLPQDYNLRNEPCIDFIFLYSWAQLNGSAVCGVGDRDFSGAGCGQVFPVLFLLIEFPGVAPPEHAAVVDNNHREAW